jgi:LPXTG-site transpeptidase (sortase) family protein
MSQYQQHNSQSPSFLDIVWRFKFYLAFYVLAISFLSFTALYLLGGVPTELRVLDQPIPFGTDEPHSFASTTSATGGAATSTPEYPIRIMIDKIGVDTAVSNPASSDISILNDALLKGAVRYPGSGTLGKGNMFIFGHSSGLRVINNQAFKAFNNLKDLTIGDTIQIHSANKGYNYKVTSVSLVDDDEALVTFSNDKNMLTLSTCNVFGQKQERYVVEAQFVKSIDLE